MPVIHSVQQGSQEWFELRAAKPTASCFDQIVTPKTLKLSAQADSLANRLLAEFVLGRPLQVNIESYQSWAMQRGQDNEHLAIEAAENILEIETEPVGFVTLASGLVGCSPDRVVMKDGKIVRTLEIKCPLPATHIGYMRNPKSLVSDYLLQLAGQLWVTDAGAGSIFSWHPEMPVVYVTFDRNEDVIKPLSEAVLSFSEVLERAKVELTQRYGPFVRPPKPVVEEDDGFDSLGVSEADLDVIWEASKGK